MRTLKALCYLNNSDGSLLVQVEYSGAVFHVFKGVGPIASRCCNQFGLDF